MNARSFFSNPVQLVLGLAILFAAASVGFFVAVLLQGPRDQKMAVLKPLSAQEKADVMQSLSESTDTQGRGAHADATTTVSAELSPAEIQRRMDVLNSLKDAR